MVQEVYGLYRRLKPMVLRKWQFTNAAGAMPLYIPEYSGRVTACEVYTYAHSERLS